MRSDPLAEILLELDASASPFPIEFGVATDPVAYELADVLKRRAGALEEAAASLVRGAFVGDIEEAAEAGDVRWLLAELAALLHEAARRTARRSRRTGDTHVEPLGVSARNRSEFAPCMADCG